MNFEAHPSKHHIACDSMTLICSDIKTTARRHPDIISAKVPDWLFFSVEDFRNENDLKCRNAAIVALLALGLHECGKLSKEECQKALAEQGCEDVLGAAK